MNTVVIQNTVRYEIISGLRNFSNMYKKLMKYLKRSVSKNLLVLPNSAMIMRGKIFINVILKYKFSKTANEWHFDFFQLSKKCLS